MSIIFLIYGIKKCQTAITYANDYQRSDFMSKNMLTAKEATLLSDLLVYEESAAKKARLYSRILTNPKLAEKATEIADGHQKRFSALFGLL